MKFSQFLDLIFAGKILKVWQVGDEVVQWSMSNVDGTDAKGGKGSIPSQMVIDLKLTEQLRPESGVVTRWAVLNDQGNVLETGMGQIPKDTLNKVQEYYEYLIRILVPCLCKHLNLL